MPYVFLDGDAGQVSTPPINATGATILFSATGSGGIGNNPNVDDDGNTHTLRVQQSGTAATALYDCLSVVSAGPALVVPIPGLGGTSQIAVMAFSGGNGAGLGTNIDGTTSTSGVSAVTSLQCGAVSATAAQQIIITTLCTTGSPINFQIDSGFTIGVDSPAISGTRFGVHMAYKINPTGTEQPTWSWTNTGQASSTIALYGAADAVGELKTINILDAQFTGGTPEVATECGLALEDILRSNGLRP